MKNKKTPVGVFLLDFSAIRQRKEKKHRFGDAF